VNGKDEWTADAANTDNLRWDCRMADPTFAVLSDGSTYIGYRGTKCCCDEIIGAWGNAGEHEYETAGMLHAASWNGSYTRSGIKIFGEDTDNEDMHMWASPRGVHMLMHSQDNSHHNHQRRGAYAYSPDGNPTNWRLSSYEAWNTHIAFDDCEGMSINKRQRPSVLLDVHTGQPTHLLTGIASSDHGLKWGDGWTVLQPLDTASARARCNEVTASQCCLVQCSLGKIGHAGACDTCSSDAVTYCDAGQVTSSVARDSCVCRKCGEGRMGQRCEYAADVGSFTCPPDGYALLPGTVGGELFRCGAVKGTTPTGWYGNCVPADAMCDMTKNCEDLADEAHCSGGEAVVPCAWPLVRDIDGLCKECTHNAVPRCLEGQIVPSSSQNSCVCSKCEVGWLGPSCDIQDSTVEPPTPPSTTAQTPSPTSAATTLPLTTPNPTSAPGLCKSWCSTHSKPWEKKCKWNNCEGCSSCSKNSGQCLSWCASNTQPWSKKCTWNKCNGCSPCTDGVRRLRGSESSKQYSSNEEVLV